MCTGDDALLIGKLYRCRDIPVLKSALMASRVPPNLLRFFSPGRAPMSRPAPAPSMARVAAKIPILGMNSSGMGWGRRRPGGRSNKFKSDLLRNVKQQPERGDYFRAVLLDPLPKYLWRAKAVSGERPMLDLLFDATDIEQAPLFIRAVECDWALGKFLRGLFRSNVMEHRYGKKEAWTIAKWFAQQLDQQAVSEFRGPAL